jgi:hypothetical protein
MACYGDSFLLLLLLLLAAVEQSVLQLTLDWTPDGSGFESVLGKKSSLLHIVQTGSGAHPATYQMGI